MYFGSNVQPLNLYTGVTICEKNLKKTLTDTKTRFLCEISNTLQFRLVFHPSCRKDWLLWRLPSALLTENTNWHENKILFYVKFPIHLQFRLVFHPSCRKDCFCEDCPVLYWQSNPGKCGGRVECNDLKKF